MLLVAGLGACKGKTEIAPTLDLSVQSGQLVRVLLLNDATACKFMLTSPFEVSVETSSRGGEGRKTRFGTSGGGIPIALSGGMFTIGSETFAGGEISIKPAGANVFSLDGADYRGALRLVLNDEGASFDVINDLSVESYLSGVIGAEMPDYWEPEALKAQTIAARTYCLYIKQRFGSSRSWDVKKTQAHQMYQGVKAESSPVRSAVSMTKGQVLVCTQDDGSDGIFPCYYSSACGGHTENSNHVFGDSFAPLVGVRCEYCADVARPKYYFWPTAKFDIGQVSDKLLKKYPKLKALGQITDITVTEQSDYGTYHRLTRIKLSGSTGKSDTVRAEDLRLTIDPSGRMLRSTMCEISKSDGNWTFCFGRGFGHGVGMCQCGAQSMARQGRKAEQILGYYYPNSRIAEAY